MTIRKHNSIRLLRPAMINQTGFASPHPFILLVALISFFSYCKPRFAPFRAPTLLPQGLQRQVGSATALQTGPSGCSKRTEESQSISSCFTDSHEGSTSTAHHSGPTSGVPCLRINLQPLDFRKESSKKPAVFPVCLCQASFHRKKETSTNTYFVCKFAIDGGIGIDTHRDRQTDR